MGEGTRVLVLIGAAVAVTVTSSCGSDSQADPAATESTGGTTAGQCPIGALGCPCTQGGVCDVGLACFGGFCVPDPGQTGGGEADTAVDGPSSGTGQDTNSNRTTAATSADGVTTGGPGSTSGESSSESTGDLLCGNGEIDLGEACDDGNALNGDGCNNDCTESGQLLWEVNVPTIYDLDEDVGRGAAIDSMGNVFVTGNITTTAVRDLWVGKFSPDGIAIWEDIVDGPGDVYDLDLGRAVAIDGNDEPIVVGAIETGVEELNIWVRKYTSGGNTVWTQEVDNGLQEQATGVLVDGDEIVVAGYISIGNSESAWIRRFDANGGTLWTETFQVAGDTISLGLGAGPSGTFAMSGYGGIKWAAKYDGTPTQLWSHNDNGSGGQFFGAAVDSAGDVYVVGIEANTLKVKKLDGVTGTEIWAEHTYQGVLDVYAAGFGITVDSADAIIVVGFEVHPVELYNTFVRKYSADGDLFWSRTFDGAASGDDQANGVAIGPDDEIVVTGYTTVVGEGENIWVAKFSP